MLRKKVQAKKQNIDGQNKENKSELSGFPAHVNVASGSS